MRPNDALLIGMDRLKEDSDILNAAYNDKQGITAKFNMNMLNVINRELDANFALEHFVHEAKFNDKLRRIESRLIALEKQEVEIKAIDKIIHFSPGDSILTEISQKFSVNDIEKLLTKCRLKTWKHFEAPNKYFSLILAHTNDE